MRQILRRYRNYSNTFQNEWCRPQLQCHKIAWGCLLLESISSNVWLSDVTSRKRTFQLWLVSSHKAVSRVHTSMPRFDPKPTHFPLHRSSAATFGGFPVGLALAFTSSALPQLRDSPLHVSDQQGSLVGSMLPLGAMLSGPLAGRAMQVLGRRSALVLVSLPATVGWMLLTYAGTLTALLLGRMLTGVAVGWTTVVVPTYVAEVTGARVRGPSGAVFELQLNLGVLMSYVVGKYAGWRLLAILSGGMSVVWLAMITLSCQSPLWLAQQGRLSEARDTLRWLRGDQADIEAELSALGRDQASRKVELSDLKLPEHRRPLVLALLVLILQQACGVNSITFYATDIFAEAGGEMESSTAAIYCGLTKVRSVVVMAVGGYVTKHIATLTAGCDFANSSVQRVRTKFKEVRVREGSQRKFENGVGDWFWSFMRYQICVFYSIFLHTSDRDLRQTSILKPSRKFLFCC